MKYRAFLSYAHADAKTAADLHKRLEAFRIDKDLAGRETALGTVPKSLRPIFRDRDDFSGGHTLTEATIAALDASAALIVLCSTVAATRPAVNEEVRLFVARHPGRPVIPVILDGQYPDNFPPALRFEIDADGSISDRPVTRLAADLTAEPRDLVLSKIVAGMTGLTPNEIYQREKRHQKQRARLRAAVAAVMLGLAGAGGYLYWRTQEQSVVIADAAAREKEVAAMVERECAKRPQACAANPGQKQDMATAIRSLLADADDGDATAARVAELLRAGKTEEAIDVQVAAAEARERRAASENKRAAKTYRDAAALAAAANPGRARDLYARAARLDLDDIEGILQHGWFQQEAGNLREAEAAYNRVLTVGKAGTHDFRLYWARLGIGDIQAARGALPTALASYREAGLIAGAKAKADPGNAGWQRDLSVSYDRVGDVLVAQGNLPQALDSFKASLAIADRLAKQDQNNAGWQRDLSVSYIKVGDVLVDQGNLPQALDSFKASLAIADRLAKADPGNAGWQADLAASHGKLGQLSVALGEKAEALRLFKAGRAIVAPLAERSGHQLWIGYLKSFDADIAALEGR